MANYISKCKDCPENKSLRNKLAAQENQISSLCREITEMQCRSDKYYELQTQGPNSGIYYNTFLTSDELWSERWQREVANLKSGEYLERIVHLKEISKSDYVKFVTA